MHEVAWQETSEQTEDWFQFNSFHWSPDGKQIGFIYHGAFYTLPVD
jgi:hypothetical protein